MVKCKDHPMAPHGFLRNPSHDAGRYVCECEYWDEDDYNLSIDNILQGEKITVDDSIGYEESTHEKQQEWSKRRNDPWNEWKSNKDIV